MVALAVRFFGQAPVTCAARPLLHRAHTALEKSSFIEAGCLLREAIRVYLAAEAEYHGVKIPKRKERQTPRALLAALERHGVCSKDSPTYYCLTRLINVGNRSAHCQFVRPEAMGMLIEGMHRCLDDARHLKQLTGAAARLEGGAT